jgi:hypothetical protein
MATDGSVAVCEVGEISTGIANVPPPSVESAAKTRVEPSDEDSPIHTATTRPEASVASVVSMPKAPEGFSLSGADHVAPASVERV